MKFKRIALIIGNMAIIALLAGCGKTNEPVIGETTPQATSAPVVESGESAATTESELLVMLKAGEQIEIEVITPQNIEQGEEVTINWTQLDQLTSQPELRKSLDDTFKIINVDNTKNGVLYVNLDGNQDGNNTLYNVFANSIFRNNYWNNESVQKEIATAVESNYADIEVESDDYERAMLAAINAYFNILNDSEPGYANLDSTISRIEAMSAIFKAEYPVTEELSLDQSFNDAIGVDASNEYAIFASNLSEQSYLTTSTGSLNSHTTKSSITRGELVYLLVQQYFADEYKLADPSATCFEDVVNGGDIATQQKFIENDTNKTGWQSYELVYALQNVAAGCPERMYKALVVAYDKGIINDIECRWDEAATKADLLEMLTNTYEALPVQTSAERGIIAGYEAPTEQTTVEEVVDKEEINDIGAGSADGEYDTVEDENPSEIVEEAPSETEDETPVETPVDDETPARKNTIPEDEIQWYLDNLGLTREDFDKLTDDEVFALFDAWLNNLVGGGSSDSGSGDNGNSGGSSSNIPSDDPNNPGDDGGRVPELGVGTVEGNM